MTKRGSFKRAVRRQARESGKRYTEALSTARSGGAMARRDFEGHKRLPGHLEERYGISVQSLSPLSPHGAAVFRVARHDGPPWVARVFTRFRSGRRVRGDAEILDFLERRAFPAERCAHGEPVTALEDQHVLVTELVEGTPGGPVTPELEHALADMLGRLHALPEADGAVARDGGAFVHTDAQREGRPGEDLVAALSMLAQVEDAVPAAGRSGLESLHEQIAAADDCEGLPEALLHPDMVDRNVILTPDGTRVAVDWRGAGRGPRLASLAFLLHGAGLKPRGDTEIIDAILSGYGRHVQLEPEELGRLAGAMRIRPLYFAAWYYRSTVDSGKVPTGTEGWWPDDDLTDAIAARAVSGFRQL